MEEKFYFIETLVIPVSEDMTNTMDLAGYGSVVDFSIKNTAVAGGPSVIPEINGIQAQILAAGDPMLMLGGYENTRRRDRIKLTFSGAGTNSAIVYLNIRVSLANCLV